MQDLIAHHINFKPDDNRKENLIMLCPTHAAMADKGKIDRKSCMKYKEIISKMGKVNSEQILDTYTKNIKHLLKNELNKVIPNKKKLKRIIKVHKSKSKIVKPSTSEQFKTHQILITVSSDRTIYPLESVVHVRVNAPQLIAGEPIYIEAYDESRMILSKKIDPEKFRNLELKSAGLYETSFVMKGDYWKIGNSYTVKAKHGEAEAFDSFTIGKRMPVVQSDKSVYRWGEDMILTVIDPDADKDSDKVEYVGDRADSRLTIMSSKGILRNYRLRETGDNTGIFQGIIGFIGTYENGKVVGCKHGNKIITKTQGKGIDDGFIKVGRGDELTITYTNSAGKASLITYSSNFGAVVELDQKKYTSTDKVYITVVAPDLNFNSKKIDFIGDKPENQITISTKKGRLRYYKLKETGIDTGIFKGRITLTGFQDNKMNAHDRNRRRVGITKGKGPTDGMIAASNKDSIEVVFNYFGEENIIGRAKIV